MVIQKAKPIDTTLVEQRRNNDCGIAALAMLYSIPYEHAECLVLSAEKAVFDGTTIDHARSVGKAMGDPIRIWRRTKCNLPVLVSRLTGRPAVLIVPAKDHRVSGDWHALYWNGKHVFDPSPTGKYGKQGVKALKTLTECWVLQSDGR